MQWMVMFLFVFSKWYASFSRELYGSFFYGWFSCGSYFLWLIFLWFIFLKSSFSWYLKCRPNAWFFPSHFLYIFLKFYSIYSKFHSIYSTFYSMYSKFFSIYLKHYSKYSSKYSSKYYSSQLTDDLKTSSNRSVTFQRLKSNRVSKLQAIATILTSHA